MFQVLPVSSHTGAQSSMPPVNCFIDDMLLQSDHAAVRHHFRSAILSAVDMLLHNYLCLIFNWLQVRTILWPQVCDVRQLTAVWHLFDAVQYAVKIIASLLQGKLQTYKTGMRCLVYMCLYQMPSGIFLAKLDDVGLSYQEYEKGDVFFWDTV